MARRMPVLRQDDVLEALGERIHERHHLVAFLHREPAAGAKVVLYVDDDQGVPDSGLGLRRRRHSAGLPDRKSTRLNSSHVAISYAVFCLKKKKNSSTVTVFM